jgi:hypothetical protein
MKLAPPFRLPLAFLWPFALVFGATWLSDLVSRVGSIHSSAHLCVWHWTLCPRASGTCFFFFHLNCLLIFLTPGSTLSCSIFGYEPSVEKPSNHELLMWRKLKFSSLNHLHCLNRVDGNDRDGWGKPNQCSVCKHIQKCPVQLKNTNKNITSLNFLSGIVHQNRKVPDIYR